MSEAWNILTDSYLKRMKRPELFNFNKDQSFGANMVHGSENINAAPMRNQANAKFGALATPAGNLTPRPTNAALPGLSVPGAAGFLPYNDQFNMPMAPSKQKDTFSTLMNTTMGVGGKMATGSGIDWMKSLYDKVTAKTNPSVDEAMRTGMGYMMRGEEPLSATERAVEGLLSNTAPMSGVENAVENFGANAAQEGIEQGLSGSTAPTGFDPYSMGLSMMPGLTKLAGGGKIATKATEGVANAAMLGLALAQPELSPLLLPMALFKGGSFLSSLFG